MAMSATVSKTDHWTQHARQWQFVGSPLRPGAEDITTAARFIERQHARGGRSGLQSVLLGVTPELVSMAWPLHTRLLAVDRSPGMIRSVLPGRSGTDVDAVCGNWLDLPLPAASVDCVVGDGCFTVLESLAAHRALSREVRRVLDRDGFFVIRLFVQLPEPESVDQVFDELSAGAIGNFHVFKWRLAMALQRSQQSGVGVHEIWRRWQQAGISAQSLSQRTGWGVDEIRTIEAYRDAPARYTFPTLAQAREVLHADFRELACHVPDYELGQRCPTLLLAPLD
ncbi:class I SAM-dependent methyltransferase [Wenzhouxiangella sp. XN201]|nr:class I SAM-dependent methyltransferase [Wenzhouxiangella sp. XN201]